MDITQIPLISNCISFNGILQNNPIDVGGGYFAINLLGKNGEEFPVFLLKTTKEDLSENILIKNDWVAGLGFLEKIQNEWAIMVYQINRIPKEEEFKEDK